MYFIRNFQNQLSLMKQNKAALSPYDDKRFILKNGIDTLAHFHYQKKSLTVVHNFCAVLIHLS